jgi:RHS repeat-associated protein
VFLAIYAANREMCLSRLKVADSATASEDRGYLYDAAWNLNKRTNNTTVTTFGVNGKNELTSGPTGPYTYDANGNLQYYNNNLMRYLYDDENQLTAWEYSQTAKTEFVYDGRGRLRVRKEFQWVNGYPWYQTGETRYLYDGMRVIQERNSGGTPTVSYTRGTDLSGTLEGAGGIGGMLGRSHGYSAGNWSTHNFFQADGNGNITYLVNSSQGLFASYRYDPYGNTISSSGNSANVYRFSSKEIHVNSGLYYYGYRWYHPNLQRWLNKDPIGEKGGINLYQTFGHDPIGSVDAFGLDVPGPGREPTPDPIFDPEKWKKENCLAYALNRPCDKDMYPGVGQGSEDSCNDLKKALKDNYGALDPTLGKCPPGWHKIRVYPGFHIQRQDGDGKWSEKNKGHAARRCATDSSGEPVDQPQDPGIKPKKPCKGDLCVPN